MKEIISLLILAALGLLAVVGLATLLPTTFPDDGDTFTIRRYYVDEELITCVVATEFETTAMSCDWGN